VCAGYQGKAPPLYYLSLKQIKNSSSAETDKETTNFKKATIPVPIHVIVMVPNEMRLFGLFHIFMIQRRGKLVFAGYGDEKIAMRNLIGGLSNFLRLPRM
jgi:hypothetical protein